jgi:hypothetical protein
MPVLAAQHSRAGARAFAAFFIKTLDWGMATVSGTYLRHYAARDCSTCRSLAHDLDADRAAEHRYIGGRSRVIRVREGVKALANAQIVEVRSTSFEELSKSGSPIAADPAYPRLRYVVTLRWRFHWEVTRLAVAL